jgi:hypothetical protein
MSGQQSSWLLLCKKVIWYSTQRCCHYFLEIFPSSRRRKEDSVNVEVLLLISLDTALFTRYVCSAIFMLTSTKERDLV